MIPLEVFDQASGEGISFEPKKLTDFLLSTYGLSEKQRMKVLKSLLRMMVLSLRTRHLM